MFDAAAADAVLDFPARPDDRLRLALRRLDEALAAQADAVTELRAGLLVLQSAVGGLDDGVARYRDVLDRAAVEATRATAAARRLETTAAALVP